ncbi:MAG TPA: choice-of-anchor D domain-containing protein [Acidobacteriaceae bacterium]|nr:choice-of-anchor D domain-containing protein [Acidobacteriaceae bacterium]
MQPATGDLYALTVDVNENDQGIWQDLCQAGSSGQCASPAPVFATRLDGGALEAGQGAAGSSTQIPQGSYNLSLLAAPGQAGGTVLLAGTIDLYRCLLAAGANACTFRNATNAGNACNATAAVAPAQHALAAVGQSSGAPLVFVGNDGGLWRSPDGIAETGAACSPSDSTHFQNLNPAVGAGGSLAEVVGFAQDPSQNGTLMAGLGELGTAATATAAAGSAWPQLAEGEGGFPQIDPISPNNWYAVIGAGVNLKECALGTACTAADFLGSADIGAAQTSGDAALLDAPTLLDPQLTSNVLTGTCRVWRGPAQNGAGWSSANALSPALDGGANACTVSSALIRSLAAGGPSSTSGATQSRGSEVLYAGMSGALDGGGKVPGHLFVTKAGNTASSSTPWTDMTGSPVTNDAGAFNAFGFDLSSVVVDPHDSTGGTVYATVMGFADGPHVYRSVDFGEHWVSLNANLPDAPANSLVVDPNDANTVYVATDTGVYATQAIATCATQNCWSLLGTALPNAPVTQLEAGSQLPTGDGRVGMLRAGTYGRGIWQIPLLTAHNLSQPQLSASPASLSFLPQPVGTQSDVLTVTLLSFGNAPVAVSSLQVTGDFVETDTCTGQSIAVNASCTVSVRFAPTATGGRSGLLTVYANIPGGQLTVALSGTASAPAAVLLTPLQLNFGAVTVNQTAAAQIVTVSNTGGNPATLQMTTVTGDFAIGANTCGSSLPPQTGCSIAITFTPTASGTRSGVLTIVDSAGTQTAQLTGTGQSPATDTLAPASLTFAQQQVGTTGVAQVVTLSNAGDVPLTLITAAILGTDFTATNACGTSLAAHSTCAISVAFLPSATGSRSATLQVTDQFRTQTVPLAGAGIAPPGISLSPSMMDFGSIGVGLKSQTAQITLTNNGGLPLLLASPSITGDFVLAASTCGTSLAPGGACTVTAMFAPGTPGARSGLLTLSDTTGVLSRTVSLTGTGVDFGLALNGPSAVTVSSGGIATYPMLLNSVSGLSGGVSFTCSGAPANSVCTVNPATAQLGGSVPVSVTLQTGVATTSELQNPQGRVERKLVFMCGLLLCPVLLGRRRFRKGMLSRLVTPLCLLALVIVGLSGCGATRLIPLAGSGGGGTTDTGGGASVSPTASGSYFITVTGTADGISHAVGVTLIVQ